MNTAHDRHLTDAQLVRVLDDEPLDIGAFDPDAHLATCDRCDQALETLRAESRLVSRFLDAAAFEEGGEETTRTATSNGTPTAVSSASSTAPAVPTPTAPPGRPAPAWLKAAAVLLLVAGPLAAFPDVRSWVIEQVTRPATPDATATAETPTVLRFVPDPGDFIVRFPDGAAGTLTVERADNAEAELRAMGGDPETVVSASSLIIRNDAEARYRLRLPAAVTDAWIRVGDRAIALSSRQIDGRVDVDLDG